MKPAGCKELTAEDKKKMESDIHRFLDVCRGSNGEYDIHKFRQMAFAAGYEVVQTGKQVELRIPIGEKK